MRSRCAAGMLLLDMGRLLILEQRSGRLLCCCGLRTGTEETWLQQLDSLKQDLAGPILFKFLCMQVVGALLAAPLLPAIIRWILLAMAAVVVVLFWWFHDQVELACHMLGLAAHGLIANKRLLVGAAALSLVVAVFGAVAVAPALGGWHGEHGVV